MTTPLSLFPQMQPSTGPQQSAPYMDPTISARSYTQQHCLPGQVDYLAHRQEVPAGFRVRDVIPEKPPGRLDLNVPHQSPQQHRRTPPPAHMGPMMMGQTPTTPLDPHQVNRGLSPGPQESRSISPTYQTSHSRHSPHHHRSSYPVVATTTPGQALTSQPFAPGSGSMPQTYSGDMRRATYPTVPHHASSQTGYVVSGHPSPSQTPYHTQVISVGGLRNI